MVYGIAASPEMKQVSTDARMCEASAAPPSTSSNIARRWSLNASIATLPSPAESMSADTSVLVALCTQHNQRDATTTVSYV